MLWEASREGDQNWIYSECMELPEVRMRLDGGAGRNGAELEADSADGGYLMNLTSFAKWQPRSNGRFISAKIDDAVAQGITDYAQRIFDTSQEFVPVDTGALKASGHVDVVQSGKQVFITIAYDAPYSVYVEFGTGRRGASSPGAGDGPYNPNWPGMPAQPYLRPAFDAHREEAADVVTATITAALG